MYSEDAVFVGDYVFWDFTAAIEIPHIVLFQYKRLIDDEKADVPSEIRLLFEKIGLWEDHINIQKTVNEEVAGGASQAISTFNRPNKFHIDFDKAKPFGAPVCVVSFTREESLRLTKGTSTRMALDIDELKNHLIGVHKWILLRKFRDLLRDDS